MLTQMDLKHENSRKNFNALCRLLSVCNSVMDGDEMLGKRVVTVNCVCVYMQNMSVYE